MKKRKTIWKVKIRKTCQICQKPLTKRFRTYCSTICRNRRNTIKYKKYRAAWQLARYDKEANEPSPKKIQCLICGKWYIQVGSHVVVRHKFESAREYKEFFDLERKRGLVPAWYRKLKGEQCKNNGSWKNVEKGKKFWFAKGDKRAGKYKRSHITLERVANLGRNYKYKTNNKKI